MPGVGHVSPDEGIVVFCHCSLRNFRSLRHNKPQGCVTVRQIIFRFISLFIPTLHVAVDDRCSFYLYVFCVPGDLRVPSPLFNVSLEDDTAIAFFAMSLGFSLKDFLTVTNLIASINGSLKNAGGSPSDYQELVRELDLLQLALTDIEHLTGPPSELPSINAIKCAALNCQYVLDEFAGKLKKFEKSLGDRRGDSSSTLIESPASSPKDQQQGAKQKRALRKAGEKLNDSVKKVEWEIFMKEDVRDLRAYLTSHVGSLNMRMITQGL
jgi:hypothetical protein